LVAGAVGSYFTGRGEGRAVLALMGVGLGVNGLLCYGLVNGAWGLPSWGIVGAGWATVVGAATSAVVGLALFLSPGQREGCDTLAGWPLDTAMLRRLLRFGVPSGLFVALDTLAFTLFVLFIGRLGEVELTATSIAFTLNLVVYMPMIGLAQAVGVRVGHRLG